MKLRTWVEIKKSALIHNLRIIRKLIGKKRILMAVVKSNAYGHGLVEIAKIAVKSESNWLGVDSINEAIRLRESGIRAPILILGYTIVDRLEELPKYDLRQVVYNEKTIKKLGKLNKSVKVHLKIETGTSRQGIRVKDLSRFCGLIKKCPKITLEGALTHYANIEDTNSRGYARKQLNEFKNGVVELEKNGFPNLIKHTACSAAALLFPDTYFDLIRLGIASYGLYPSNGVCELYGKKSKNGVLKPVLSWKTVISQIKEVKAGTPISYGMTEKVGRDSRIAVIPIGYWDGFDRGLSSRGIVLIRGKKCKVLGRVCMNMSIVDVTHLPKVELEDEVVVIGRQKGQEITADQIASKLNTINYEVVTRINPLIERIIK